MRFEKPPHDLPDSQWQWTWWHWAWWWRHHEFKRLRRRIWRGLRSGDWRYWEATNIVRGYLRRTAFVATLCAGIALGYGLAPHSSNWPRDVRGTTPAPRRELPPATLETALTGNRWRDERCELEPQQSPPVIWLASWRHEVRALSGQTDQTRTKGAYAFDYPEPTRHRRR